MQLLHVAWFVITRGVLWDRASTYAALHQRIGHHVVEQLTFRVPDNHMLVRLCQRPTG